VPPISSTPTTDVDPPQVATTALAREAAAVGSDAPAAADHALVEALGAAWSAFTLYRDPTHLEVFRRAVDAIRDAPSHPWQIEVGPDGFTSNGTLLPTRREAARRLARRIFAHGIAAVVVWDAPSSDDLRRVLEVISTATEVLQAAGGAEAALEAAGVTSIALPHRDLLVEATLAGRLDGPTSAGDRSGGDWFAAYDGDPQPFVHRLLTRSGGDPGALTRLFSGEYSRVYGLVDGDDPWGREEVVHAFADAFFHLPEQHRARLVAGLLADRQNEESRMLLDQFTAGELAEIAPLLGPETHPLLLEYARVAAEQEEGAARGDLLDLLDERDEPSPSADAIARRIEAVLRSSPAAASGEVGPVSRMRAARPGADDHHGTAHNIVRGLLAVAEDEDFERLAASWADQVTTALAEGHIADAEAHFDDAAHGARRSPEHRSTLLGTLARRLGSDAVTRLADLLAMGDDAPEGRLLQKASALFAGDALIEQLGGEADQARRRRIIEALVVVSRSNPGVLMRHLADARWFVVRNIVLILGRSRHPEVAERLAPLCRHHDSRIRREALRALHLLLGDGAAPTTLAALDDPDPEVRRLAAGLLRDVADPGIDRALAQRAGDDALGVDDRVTAVSALARRGTREATDALTRLAGRRFVFARAARTVRRAARRSLGRSR